MIRKIKTGFKKIPGVKLLIDSPSWKSLRHRITLYSSRRVNSNFTKFLRMPSQFEALTGPVFDYVFAGGSSKIFKITVLGCSNGSEAYTIASILKSTHPEIRFAVHAYDIDREVIKKARSGVYVADEVYDNEKITESFIKATFVNKGKSYEVKKEIKDLVHFDCANVLDRDLKKRAGGSDIVYAQNFICHLKRDKARIAFDNICRLMNPKAALFADGVDMDIRYKLTQKHGLRPLLYKIEEIHDEARVFKPGWPYICWGLEPLSKTRKDWQRRYSTIFLS